MSVLKCRMVFLAASTAQSGRAAWALHPATGLPPGPLKRFRIAFLPANSRTLRRDGIVFEHLRCWHPIFSQLLARRERLTLHFDPRNLSKLYVPHESDYLEVPISDLRMPAMSLWEVQAATRHLLQAGHGRHRPAQRCCLARAAVGH